MKTLLESGHEHVYDAVEKPLLWAQSAAILEVNNSSFFFFLGALSFSVDVILLLNEERILWNVQ